MFHLWTGKCRCNLQSLVNWWQSRSVWETPGGSGTMRSRKKGFSGVDKLMESFAYQLLISVGQSSLLEGWKEPAEPVEVWSSLRKKISWLSFCRQRANNEASSMQHKSSITFCSAGDGRALYSGTKGVLERPEEVGRKVFWMSESCCCSLPYLGLSHCYIKIKEQRRPPTRWGSCVWSDPA